MQKNAKYLVGGLVGVAVVLAAYFGTSGGMFQGKLAVSSKLIKNSYFEYFLGQKSQPFFEIETDPSSMGGQMQVLDENNKLVKNVCKINPGIGSGCAWDGTDENKAALPLKVAKFKFRAIVSGKNGLPERVDSPLFLFDTTGI